VNRTRPSETDASKAGCHVFPHDVRETLDIKEDTVAVTDVQQTFQSFYTPTDIADRIAALAELCPDHTLLEPSAGEGALVYAAAKAGVQEKNMTAIEINPLCRGKLKYIAGTVVIGDFLSIQPPHEDLKFDRVIMNPPFQDKGCEKHVRQALRFLRPGGRLVSIVLAGNREHEALLPITDEWIDLPEGSFKSAGTSVNTAIVIATGK
jgi:predicted RNA methylase